ncbi:MAG: HEAT repeat domain-containing protein [Deltaproteobacteria bacterium]|nr:HEAT repeat domain-containing protein [Deltaproteobacteria bacterium]
MPKHAVGVALIAGLLVWCAPAFTTQTDRVELADGAVVTAVGGRLVIESAGKKTRTRPVKHADPKSVAQLLEVHRFASDLEALHVRFAASGGGAVDAVAVRRAGQAKLKIVWQGRTGLAGEIGERMGHAVRFDDLTGDGLPEIIVGQVYEAVRLCGADRLPLLFRRVYDPATGKLRPVLAKRPDLKAAIDVPEAAADGEEASILRAASPVGASRSAGDRGDPMLLAPPGSLMDGDPKTAWFPGNDAGGGEFASFSVATSAYGVSRVGVRAVPDGVKPGRYGRPQSVILATEDGVFRLTFATDPKTRPEETVWFDLPEPTKTGCLSVVIEKTFDAKPGKPLALAELVVLTEVDSAKGLERLAADLNDADRGEQAAMLLRRAGERAVDPIRGVWPSLGSAGRRRAVRVLAEAAPGDAIDLLAAAAVGSDPVSAGAALTGLERAEDAGVSALAHYLSSEDDTAFEAAVKILGRFDREDAFDSLVTATGKGGRERRRLLRVQLASSAARSPEGQQRIWSAIEMADSSGKTEQVLDLMRAATGLPAIAERLGELAGTRLAAADRFADRYRLLEVLAGSGVAGARAHIRAGLQDEDRKIRAVAVVGAGIQRDWDEASELVRGALADDAVEVRLAALGAIVVAGIAADAAPALLELIDSEPWPDVRTRVVSMAGRLPQDDAVILLRAAADDESLGVRLAAIEVAGSLRASAVDSVIEERLADADELPELLAAAARSAGRRCQASAVPLLYELLRRGAEPLAHTEEIEAAVAAARAMGRIGGQEAGKLLEKARRRSNPATDKAIDAALETLGERCGNAPEKPDEASETD